VQIARITIYTLVMSLPCIKFKLDCFNLQQGDMVAYRHSISKVQISHFSLLI
jgi:hypothetical protein